MKPYTADKRKRIENGKEICFKAAYEPQKAGQMELIDKQEALKRINSYGGAGATDPEDKRCDNLVGYIYADVDSIEPGADVSGIIDRLEDIRELCCECSDCAGLAVAEKALAIVKGYVNG